MPNTKTQPPEATAVAEQLSRYLHWHRDAGTQALLQSTAQAREPLPQEACKPSQESALPRAIPLFAELPLLEAAQGQQQTPFAAGRGPVPLSLEEVREQLGDCRRCKLCRQRKQIVFGVGNPKAELVFVGEGPGADEDAQGIPFVGRAGQLLTKMIEAMRFSRDEVYICNVVKCRPPDNRNPEPDEIEACQPFLKAQLAAIGPRVLVALGKFAVQTLLADSTPITKLRGRWREYAGIPLMPTYHPAYLLRNPSEKKNAWLDLQSVMQRLGKPPP